MKAIIVRVSAADDYDDVADELMLEDFIVNPEAFEVELLPAPPSGHWTKDPPTKPGWYKAVIKGELRAFHVVKGSDGKWFADDIDEYFDFSKEEDMEEFDWWWSEPESLPAPPEDKP